MRLDAYLSKRGATAEFASKLGIPAALLSQWTTGVRQVPAERCPQIERESGGLVRCEDLRPDVDWPFLRGTAVERPREAAA